MKRGGKMSEAQKEKIRLSNLGQKRSTETRERIKQVSLELWQDEKFRKKFSKARTGYKETEEHKLKIQIASQRLHKDPVYIKNHLESMHRPEVTKKLQENWMKRVFPFKDTDIEVALQKELTKRSISFEKHKQIFGRPDIFLGPRICIFADGDYWHANPLKYQAARIIRHGREHWEAQQLWAYDKLVTETLEAQGYKVFRFWGREIKQSPGACIDKILTYLHGEEFHI